LAQAKQLADEGKVARIPQNGHRLTGEFEGLSVIKPGNRFRFVYFRCSQVFYVTNGAMKDTSVWKQEADYRIGKKLREEFFLDLN